MKPNVTYLQVPYSEKNIAKELGAWWDPDEKLWFIPKGIELSNFSRWLPTQTTRINDEQHENK